MNRGVVGGARGIDAGELRWRSRTCRRSRPRDRLRRARPPDAVSRRPRVGRVRPRTAPGASRCRAPSTLGLIAEDHDRAARPDPDRHAPDDVLVTAVTHGVVGAHDHEAVHGADRRNRAAQNGPGGVEIEVGQRCDGVTLALGGVLVAGRDQDLARAGDLTGPSACSTTRQLDEREAAAGRRLTSALISGRWHRVPPTLVGPQASQVQRRSCPPGSRSRTRRSLPTGCGSQPGRTARPDQPPNRGSRSPGRHACASRGRWSPTGSHGRSHSANDCQRGDHDR